MKAIGKPAAPMNPITSFSRAMGSTSPVAASASTGPPLPSNFESWPKPMRDRYRRHALVPIS